jgi:hypothetical protein
VVCVRLEAGSIVKMGLNQTYDGGQIGELTCLAFYVLLTVHLGIIFVNNQLDAKFFFMYVYFYSLHVSGSHVPIISRINCINTTSGICHSV